jgi:CRISPR-associated protein Cmr1
MEIAMPMTQLEYTVSFNTPAFLGNAGQQAQWRTPPFKALIRQWWRVVKAKDLLRSGIAAKDLHGVLREAEGRLLGHAWLERRKENGRSETWAIQSQVRLRLSPWESGKLNSNAWPGGELESVVTTKDGKGRVRADVYLGFGAVLPPSKKESRPSITIRGAIGTDKEARLQVFPDMSEEVRNSLRLIAWFGCLGSRSRNGWGSVSLVRLGDSPVLTPVPSVEDELIREIGHDWERCLDLDWPHAMGQRDGKPLIWLSDPLPNWRKAMGCLAHVRVEARRTAKSFKSPQGIGGIHLLGYPAGGKWEMPEFKKGRPNRDDEEGRLASQLRFKVCAVPGGYRAMVCHFPHRFPDVLRRRLDSRQQQWLANNEAKVWNAIHEGLDGMRARIKPLAEAG